MCMPRLFSARFSWIVGTVVSLSCLGLSAPSSPVRAQAQPELVPAEPVQVAPLPAKPTLLPPTAPPEPLAPQVVAPVSVEPAPQLRLQPPTLSVPAPSN